MLPFHLSHLKVVVMVVVDHQAEEKAAANKRTLTPTRNLAFLSGIPREKE